LLICSWICAICQSDCIGAYLNDISGAFDRVFTPHLLNKLRAHGIGEKYRKYIASFLEQRFGKVVVGGESSEQMFLDNRVFQGTVLGPPLWNIFFADVISAAMARRSTGKVFADDFN